MRLKGSYTVEAAIVMSFCMVVLGVSILFTYTTFIQSVSYVTKANEEFDAVKIFRGKDEFSELFKGYQ